MSSVNALLNDRLKKGAQSSKMAKMALESTNGNRGSFSGIFTPIDLSDQETHYLEAILREYSTGNQSLDKDLNSLMAITAEVKAINNQAALLHGERIKKAQRILTEYRDGAFTAWLIAAYGNRQTPYNFLQYFEFCEAVPRSLRPQIDLMPRQAVYTLASRGGEIGKKIEIIEKYQGETKTELLKMIRVAFPLPKNDRRRPDVGQHVIQELSRLLALLESGREAVTKSQKSTISRLLNALRETLH